MQFAIFQLTIYMEAKYVRIPKGSRESLGHQCCLTTCVLGQYPSLHDSGKTDNHLSTNDNSWVTSQVELVNRVGVVALFTWHVLSMASYFGVLVVLLTMNFWPKPKYLPQLKQSGTYVLKYCRVVCT